jgi:hypothetical protein
MISGISVTFLMTLYVDHMEFDGLSTENEIHSFDQHSSLLHFSK